MSDTDRGYKRFMAALEALGEMHVTVGIHSEEGAGAEPGGKSIIEIAEINEFGLGVDARPFVSSWGDERGKEALRELQSDVESALRSRTSPAQRLDARAQRFAGEIQQRIAGGIPPKNAESTIKKKGSSTPLIDKGIMRSSILGKVK